VPAARRPTPETLREAAWALRDGRLVVFPTETVYGLGANALDRAAVERLFLAKGRPRDNPVIVHAADVAQAQRLASWWPPEAQALADAFWPGPLTLVLPRAAGVPDVTTGGLDSVAIRVPRHPVALAILREAGVPVAAPSANRSGRPSPTRVADAMADLGERAALYVDGGPCEVGVESTVVSLLGKRAAVLREGGIPREEVEAVVGKLAKAPGKGPARSPGMKYRHYAPEAKVHLAKARSLAAARRKLEAAGLRVGAIVSEESDLGGSDVRVLGARGDGAAWARGLFAALRDLDRAGCQAIVVEEVPAEGLGAAVMERLRKAVER